MNFARKQLEKYGWTDGKGLGKHENGISQALKPKLKRGVTGIGHDAAAEFTEHWWTKLYNTAANNVEVKEVNGKTKKIKTKDDEFEITNSTWTYKKKNKPKSKEEYTNFFVKTSILTNGGVKTEDLEETENVKENDDTKIVKLTDEQLFAACEGRTAHKGARHGLKALGKLTRIEMQEQMLLHQPKYIGYSKTIKKHDEGTNTLNHGEVNIVKKRKKKHNSSSDWAVNGCTENPKLVEDKQKKVTEFEKKLNTAYNLYDDIKLRKKKKHLNNIQDSEGNLEDTPLKVKKATKNKGKQKLNHLDNIDEQGSSVKDEESNIVTVKRKYYEIEHVENSDPIPKKKSKRKSVN